MSLSTWQFRARPRGSRRRRKFSQHSGRPTLDSRTPKLQLTLRWTRSLVNEIGRDHPPRERVREAAADASQASERAERAEGLGPNAAATDRRQLLDDVPLSTRRRQLVDDLPASIRRRLEADAVEGPAASRRRVAEMLKRLMPSDEIIDVMKSRGEFHEKC